MRPNITMSNDHGLFQASGYAIDKVISQYLPASVNDLRRKLAEVSGIGHDAPENYSDVNSVSEALVMLADVTVQSELDARYLQDHGISPDEVP